MEKEGAQGLSVNFFCYLKVIYYFCKNKKNNMKKSILRFYKRFKVYLGKLGRSKGLKTEEYLQDHEKIAFRICVKLISHEDSELVIAPMSQKRFIVNNTLNLFCTLDWGRIELTNHTFHYDVKLSGRDFERVLFLFDKESEKRRSVTESIVQSQINDSLIKILNKINNRVETHLS